MNGNESAIKIKSTRPDYLVTSVSLEQLCLSHLIVSVGLFLYILTFVYVFSESLSLVRTPSLGDVDHVKETTDCFTSSLRFFCSHKYKTMAAAAMVVFVRICHCFA